MNKGKYLGLVMVLAMTLTLIVGVSAQEMKVIHTGVGMVGGDPESIDPNLNEASQGNNIIRTMYIGLTTQDEETGDVVPGLATDWSQSEDGLTWTFNMIHDIPWAKYNADTDTVEQVMDEAGNPRYVTANDVVYSWKRVLDPATASTYAYVPAEFVVNGTAVMAGEASVDDLAVKAVDDYTFEITAPEAVGFATNIYGLWMVNPVPQWAIEECGDSWTEADCMPSYGPFVLKDWSHDESITVVKNPFWPGTDYVPQAQADEVVFHFLDPQTQFAEYQADTLDAINPPIEELDRIKSDAVLSQELSIGTNPCTYYIGINAEKPVVGESVHLRRALSYAVDRQSIVDNVTKGGQIPAQWFSRPGLNAAPTLETNPDLGAKFDVAKAQEELTLALDELGVASAADIPTITLAYNDSSGHAAIMQAIQQMWSTELGITVQLDPRDPSTYFSSLSEDAPQLYRSGWCQDYPDADNFLRGVFRSDSQQNDPNFVNADFDALVDEARLATDTEERRALYAQAEEILSVDQVGMIPIYWYTAVQMTKPYIERTYSVVNREAYENWNITQ
ncbi:MAG: peptide ABC transporter substrate-binding protein [Anaerolineae bacterium]|nr:peptide ABC transporter substrate-binding protein [Anaerolineae bacterium]